MKPWLIGGTGVLVFAIVAIFLGDFFSRPKESVNERDEDSPEVTTPRNTVGSKAAAPTAPPAPAQDKVEAPPAQPPSPAQDLTPEEKTLEGTRPPNKTGPIEELKRAYNAESTVSSSRDTEQQIRALFGVEYLPIEMLRSINCRITVCKVSVYWTKDNPLSYMVLAMKVGYQQSQIIAIESGAETDREGRLPVEVYVLRSGYTLADIQ